MDSLKIKFCDSQNKNYIYEFRIPENINWFSITRYLDTKNNNLNSDQIIYNGNELILRGYSYINKIKKNKYYYNEIDIIKEFAYDILKSLGINSFTLKILDILGIDTKKIKLKYWKSYFFNNNEKYILEENFKDNEKYLNILSSKSNDTLGKLSINEGKVEFIVCSNKLIDIEKLYKAIEKMENNKTKILS